jgi:SEC-C motif-containing protein
MRSRYTAHVKADVAYLEKTLAPEARQGFDPATTRRWAQESKWKSLKVLSTEKGGPGDTKGIVEFVATYERADGQGVEHHEVSRFRKSKEGDWYFVDGDAHEHAEGQGHHHHHHHAPKGTPVVRETAKVGRNDACPCGSGKKYKKCCGANG